MTVHMQREQYGSDPHFDRDPSRRWPWVLLAVGLTILVVAGSGVLWLEHQINPTGTAGGEVRVTVAHGMSTAEIGQLLERQGVIANAGIFKLYLKLTGSSAGIEAGDYTLRKRSHLAAVVKTLEGGAAKEVGQRLTVPEGLTLDQIAIEVGKQLPGRSAEKFLQVAKDGSVHSQYQPPGTTNLEGMILPETYFVAPGDDEAKVLQRMVTAFDETATRLDVAGAAARSGLTPYQVIVMASVVEREALVDADRGKVARVVLNRLNAKMPLQMDSTVIYALGKHTTNLTLKDREVKSPYNTFLNQGLPPGPISGPGVKSLEAAVRPTPGNWLYFVVVDANGTESFTADYNQFLRDAATCAAKGLCD